LTLIFFNSLTVFSQDEQLLKLEAEFEKIDYKTRLNKLKSIDLNKLSVREKALVEHLYGKTYYLYNSGNGAVEHFIKAKNLYIKAKDYDKVTELSLTLAEQKRLSEYKYEEYKPLLDEAIRYAEKSNKDDLLCATYLEVGISLQKAEPQKAIEFHEKGLKIARKIKNQIYEIRFNRNIGLTYCEFLKDFEKALYYQNLSLEQSREIKYTEGVAYAYVNLASIARNLGEFEKAIKYYNIAENLKFDNYRTNFNIILYQYISDTYRQMKDFEKAIEYLDKKKVLEEIVSKRDEEKYIRDINTKYETKEKELENQELKLKDEKNKLVIYSFIGLFLIILAGAYFRISHINKKKKIAEQERLIESQKLENVLKDQELKEIDKILEGQEKERLKIANDLHDNLGSILATLKLNFQNLYSQKNKNGENGQALFDKTNELIEEAYQKVRGMAHAKNAGVIGSEGLVPAVQNIAKKIAIPGKLTVQVIPFGMTKRFENAMEVTLFRMIQELLTNAIKHAEATAITISLTQDEESINIIIEDNGKGFNPKKTAKNDGMGLSNITKKVEQLNGTFNIDSFEGKGSSIIIDIPL